MEEIIVAKIGDFRDAAIKTVMVWDTPIIISKFEGKFYAVDALCTHAHGYLPKGIRDDACIICPVHHAKFDLKTGKMLKNVPGLIKLAVGGAEDLTAYNLSVEGDDIKISRKG